MEKLFGTDGIRGVANSYPVDPQTGIRIGRAVVRHFGSPSDKRPILIGKDTRISGYMLTSALAAGIASAGCDVDILGTLPTPGVACLTVKDGASGGIVVSASHNPYTDNGFKFFGPDGCKLSDEDEYRLETRILAVIDADEGPVSDHVGRIRQTAGDERYLAFLSDIFPPGDVLKGVTLVLDCANGATSRVAPRLFKSLEATVIPLFDAPDGININAGCGSEHPETLAQTVVSRGGEMGLAFDGDGDRLVAVDEKGRVLSGDQILAICAQHLKTQNRLTEKTVVSTVMSNIGLTRALEQLGIRHLRTDVGDRHVMAEMKASGAVLGGENSGHMIFREHHTTGDGLVAAVNLLDAVQSAGQPLSELAGLMTVYPQYLMNVDVSEKPDIETVGPIRKAIASVEKRLGDQGRVLVRYSGTQPMCRIMVEGPTESETRTYCEGISEIVKINIGKK